MGMKCRTTWVLYKYLLNTYKPRTALNAFYEGGSTEKL